MSRTLALARLLVLTIAAFAVSSVPVVRAFTEAASLVAAAPAFVPKSIVSSTRLAHRMPRLRRPKQSLVLIASESGPSLPAAASARRPASSRERVFAAASCAAPLDHPPA